MLVTAIASMGTCRRSSILSTPMWAAPPAPPPESTSPMRGRGAAGISPTLCAPGAAQPSSSAVMSIILAVCMHKLQAAIKLDRMSLAFIISLVIQVVLIIHCIRSGRNTLWIWAIALLPLAGPVAYVLVEVLPALFRSRGTRLAVRGMRKALDPEQDLRRFELEART